MENMLTNEELQQEIITLKERVARLEKPTQLVYPLDVVSEELVKNAVTQGEDSTTGRTEVLTVAASSAPFSNNYTIAKKFDGLLVIRWKNKFYKVGYYN